MTLALNDKIIIINVKRQIELIYMLYKYLCCICDEQTISDKSYFAYIINIFAEKNIEDVKNREENE